MARRQDLLLQLFLFLLLSQNLLRQLLLLLCCAVKRLRCRTVPCRVQQQRDTVGLAVRAGHVEWAEAARVACVACTPLALMRRMYSTGCALIDSATRR